MPVPLEHVAKKVKHRRRIVNFPQQGGVARGGESEDSGSHFLYKGKFPSKIHMAFPLAQGFGGLRPHSLDLLQTTERGAQNGSRRTERFQ